MTVRETEEFKPNPGVRIVVRGFVAVLALLLAAILAITYYEGVLRDRYVGQMVIVNEGLAATVVAVRERYLTIAWMSANGLTVSEIHLKDFDALTKP